MSTRPPFLPADAHRDPPVAIVRIGAVDDPSPAVEAVRALMGQGFGYFDLEVARADALRGLEAILDAAPSARLNVRVAGDEVVEPIMDAVHQRDALQSTCFVGSQRTLNRIRALAGERGFRANTAMSPDERARAIAGASGGRRRMGRSAAACIQVAERIDGIPVDLLALQAVAHDHGIPIYVEVDDDSREQVGSDRVNRLADRVYGKLGLFINGVISINAQALALAFTGRGLPLDGSRRVGGAA